MPKLNLRDALRIKVAGGEVLRLKGEGFAWPPAAPVGPAVIQSTAKLQVSGANLPQTFSDVFPLLPTEGNDVVLLMAYYGGSLPSSVSIAGTVATLDANNAAATGDYHQLVYRARIGSSPNRNVTVSGSGSVYITCAALEVSPLAGSPVDQVNGSYEWTPATTPVSISTVGSTTQADELVVAHWTSYAVSTTNLGTSAPADSGYTEMWTEQNHSAYMGGQCSYKIVNATGVQSASWTRDVDDYALAQIITYKFA